MKFPEHKGELCLTHNPHKNYYMTAKEWLAVQKNLGHIIDDEFIDELAQEKCIEMNEIWELQWYPDTPVGFIRLYGPSLPELLEKACSSDELSGDSR